MHKFANIPKTVKIGDPSWSQASQYGIINLKTRYIGNNRLETNSGHQFINMCSCSYLGLNIHPAILQSAIDEIKSLGFNDEPTSRLRILPIPLEEVEAQLENLFGGSIITGPSCGTVSQGILPLIAAGELTNKKPPVMIFDKNAHFSMNVNKAACGDETTVLTCAHNDLNFIEDICKKHTSVAYVADGTYSMGGHAPIRELLELQNKYGLFLYFDDSHSLSTHGKMGCGYIRSHMKEVSDRTVIAATLSKAFGASGAIAMMAPCHMEIIKRFGGGLAWSQYLNSGTIGAVKGSIRIHNSTELIDLQRKLRKNIEYFDSLLPTSFRNTDSAIRLIVLNQSDEKALICSKKLFEHGFYSSAVFFPVVAKGQSGLRIMLRANMDQADIKRFTDVLKKVLSEESVELSYE